MTPCSVLRVVGPLPLCFALWGCGGSTGRSDSDAVLYPSAPAVAGAGSALTPAKPAPLQPPTLPSDWAMVGFEDPVALSFAKQIGCYTGLPVKGSEKDCGPLRSLGGEGLHRTLAMTFKGIVAPGVVTYAADVYVSEDGRRMAGSFLSFTARANDVPLPEVASWPLGYAWLPLDGAQNGQVSILPHTLDALPVPEPAAEFVLVEDENGLAELLPNQRYGFAYRDTGRGLAIVGDLGAFFDTELRWDEATQTLSAGPVAATRPGYPVALAVRFEERRLVEARATTAGGGNYRLLRAPPKLP
jgi:hypothetical protein